MAPILFPLKRATNPAAVANKRGGSGPLVGWHPLPVAPPVFVTGVSRDANGNPLASCTCTLFRVANGVATQLATQVSDGGGNYSFLAAAGQQYRVTFDLAGAPSVAGLTLPTLAAQ